MNETSTKIHGGCQIILTENFGYGWGGRYVEPTSQEIFAFLANEMDNEENGA